MRFLFTLLPRLAFNSWFKESCFSLQAPGTCRNTPLFSSRIASQALVSYLANLYQHLLDVKYLKLLM